MKYQAVARSLSGQVMANQPVTLKISLNSKVPGSARTHYSETHSVTTNALGLFDLTIGAGVAGMGTFKNVPWSTEDIWMEIAIQEGGKSGFSTISSSRLLAVPYAFHAMTANQLAGDPKARVAGGGPSDGVPGNVWSTFGNTKTDPTTDRMGTMDYADLIFVTNKTERLRITKDGDINIANSLNVGKDVEVGNNLTVKKDVFLNTTGGATISNGPLTVANAKPTVLTGTLNVNGATDLDNTLNVDGNTTLNGLTKSTNTTQSDNTSNGALTVAGGVGISKNLNVGGNANFGGSATFGGVVNITDATESTNTTTGALIVTGGVGIGKRINVGGAAALKNTLSVDGATTLKSTLGVDGATDLNSTLNADGATTLKSTLGVDGATNLKNTLNTVGATTLKNTLSVDGATGLNSTLNVTGGAALQSTLNVVGVTTLNNKVNANAQVTIEAIGNGPDTDYNAYPLRVQGSNQGIAIKVNGSRNTSNNFVTFMDVNGIQGRIEGQTLNELTSSTEYEVQVALFALQAAGLAADIVGLTAEGVALVAAVITAASAVGVTAQGVAAGVELAALVIETKKWSDDIKANVGVAYESGNGDYAEWLERGAAEKDMVFGQIVGVTGGKLSLRTDKADHYMVVSRRPIVLGNMPAANREKDFEKVAFMGQVPVRVVGQVAIGDYVIPSGNNDGMGIAVHPAEMKLGDYARIVGVAWQAAKDASLNVVNVAVGINTNDLTNKMVAMSRQLDSLSRKTDNILAFLQGKAPLQTTNSVASEPTGNSSSVTASSQAQTTLTKTVSDEDFDRAVDQRAAEVIKYVEVAKKQLMAQGIDVSGNPDLVMFFNNPIASVKQLRRNPTVSTQWGRFDQQLNKKNRN